MKLTTTAITRVIIYLMGLGVFTVCAILLPELAREEAVGKVNPPNALPYLIGAWVLSIPIFIALHQTIKLLHLVDKDAAFSDQSIKILQTIKRCAISFSAMIVMSAIVIIAIARSANPREDVTPVFALGFVFTFVSSVIATFTAVIQKLLQDAIRMKSENELTV